MKSFCCTIRKLEFFQSDTASFVKEVLANETVVNFAGGKLHCTLETKWKGEQGMRINNEELILLEGLIYEHKKKYISRNTLEVFSRELSRDKANVVDFNGDFRCTAISPSEVFFATNKTKSKDIFYFDSDEYLIFSSHISRIVEVLKENQIKYTLDDDSPYLLLSYGYMLGDKTLISEIKRVEPGCNATLTKEGFTISNYFKFKNRTDIELSENEWIDKLDKVFSKAIRNEFQKDLDHGFKHIVTLSGGMDSRMVLAYAKKLGFKDITNFCFSQHNHLEHKIAQEVSDYFGDHFVFVSLNNGNYLKDVEGPVLLNGGNVIYSGGAPSLHSVSQINFQSYGILHTGQLGDGFLGSLLRENKHIAPKGTMKRNLEVLAVSASNYIKNEMDRFDTDEVFQLYNRCFNGVLNGYVMIDQYAQFASAFMDEDFISLCLSIPPELRANRSIYLKWMNLKCPQAALHRLASSNVRPLKRYSKYPFKTIADGYKYWNLMNYKFNKSRVVSMVPFKKWVSENDTLKVSLDNFYKDHIKLLENYPALNRSCREQYSQNHLQQFKVLTLLGALKIMN